jgi:hypothetical protein
MLVDSRSKRVLQVECGGIQRWDGSQASAGDCLVVGGVEPHACPNKCAARRVPPLRVARRATHCVHSDPCILAVRGIGPLAPRAATRHSGHHGGQCTKDARDRGLGRPGLSVRAPSLFPALSQQRPPLPDGGGRAGKASDACCKQRACDGRRPRCGRGDLAAAVLRCGSL